MKGTTMTTKDFPAPTDEAAYWACIGFRHDFGLLSDDDADRVRGEGLAWLAAWRSAFAEGHEDAGADGLGDDWDEPFARTVDAACLTFDPGFRTRPFHEASAIRRGGIEWLQAWRRAVEDQAAKDKTPSAGLADHAQRPTIREPDEASIWNLSRALQDVADERQRQREAEGWTLDHDDGHAGGELARAGACYALHAGVDLGGQTPLFWPWSKEWFKPKNARRDLVRAAALIVAEIERGDRLTAQGIDPTARRPDDLDPGVAARCAALVRCAEADVPTDVQGLLVQGDPMRGIRPDIVGLILGLGPVPRERGSEFAVYGPGGGE
ncbi:hypothetical protein RCHOTPOCKET_48 [Rhodobacter phage RcHotPocket]|nr:hypothetical protein RCHOTPOCKET_48 [Rhodobacter phage RcHotPocket]